MNRYHCLIILPEGTKDITVEYLSSSTDSIPCGTNEGSPIFVADNFSIFTVPLKQQTAIRDSVNLKKCQVTFKVLK